MIFFSLLFFFFNMVNVVYAIYYQTMISHEFDTETTLLNSLDYLTLTLLHLMTLQQQLSIPSFSQPPPENFLPLQGHAFLSHRLSGEIRQWKTWV